MSDFEKPIVVYHVAAMGNWQEVVKEQLRLLANCGLAAALTHAGEAVRVTHVGAGLDWLQDVAAYEGVPIVIVRSDPNTDHYETFAMLEIERLAKVEQTDRTILYFHTKGVSLPGHAGRVAWRRLMNGYVVARWRENIRLLSAGYDAVGVNWIEHGEQHFSGNFWLATADWIRRLPDFAWYHGQKQMVRYSCEMWIGAAHWCRAQSLACRNQPFWEDGYRFEELGIAAQFNYQGLPCQQNPKALPAIAETIAELKPARIIEIGTGGGGFTLFLRRALDVAGCPEADVLSVDISERPEYAMLRNARVDVRIGNAFFANYTQVDWWLKSFCRRPGLSLVLCDGGSKVQEFAALAGVIKDGDFIGAHDYAPNQAYFMSHIKGLHWDWLEFTDADAAGPTAAHGLSPWRPDSLTSVQWCLMRKDRGQPPKPRPVGSGSHVSDVFRTAGTTATAVQVSQDITVCIPTIPPRADVLRRAVRSVEEQILRPAEVIVQVDSERRGAAANRTAALSRVRTPWVAFLDDDDELYPEHLAALRAFAEQTGADYVFSYFDMKVEGTARNDLDPIASHGREVDPTDPHQTTVTVMVRTDLAQRVGFRPPPSGATINGQRHGEDYQFLLDCLAAGAKVRHLPWRTWAWHHWGVGAAGVPGNTSGLPDRW